MSYAVKGYMESEVHTIVSTETVTAAAKVMAEKPGGYLLVLKEGKPIGIVTERDLVNKVLAEEVDPSTIKVSQIMATPLVTIDPDEDLLKASELMREHTVKKLPVVRNGIVYGIITAEDIANKCGTYVDKTIKDIIRWTAPLGL
ncbi:MAG: CBS domain-containing protein [Candidatus Bathyarchaeota archaeon]|nr:MAG: CBS domain-containing protein [Candidatus Bathyarchaeota archaeon]